MLAQQEPHVPIWRLRPEDQTTFGEKVRAIACAAEGQESDGMVSPGEIAAVTTSPPTLAELYAMEAAENALNRWVVTDAVRFTCGKVLAWLVR